MSSDDSTNLKTPAHGQGFLLSHRQNHKPDQNAEHQKSLEEQAAEKPDEGSPPHPEGFLPGLSLNQLHDDHGHQRSDKNAHGAEDEGKDDRPGHGGQHGKPGPP